MRGDCFWGGLWNVLECEWFFVDLSLLVFLSFSLPLLHSLFLFLLSRLLSQQGLFLCHFPQFLIFVQCLYFFLLLSDFHSLVSCCVCRMSVSHVLYSR